VIFEDEGPTTIQVEPRALHAIAREIGDPGLLYRTLAAGDGPPASLVAEVMDAFNAKQTKQTE
jgi:hypothetical protein